jgi:hypothetical protein
MSWIKRLSGINGAGKWPAPQPKMLCGEMNFWIKKTALPGVLKFEPEGETDR